MRSLLGLVTCVLLVSGCTLYFDGDDDGGGDDVCTLAEPAIAPAPLRNPETLTCESFGGGGCDPRCGPCPAVARAPIPSWGACGSTCEQLGEGACAADPQCRVIKDARCMVSGVCLTDFMACVATDTNPDTSIDCFTADSWDCSRDNQCSALHSYAACDALECPRPFELCVPEGRHPGRCFESVECRAQPPACPAGTTPGVLSGCYTGACIPVDLCRSERDGLH